LTDVLRCAIVFQQDQMKINTDLLFDIFLRSKVIKKRLFKKKQIKIDFNKGNNKSFIKTALTCPCWQAELSTVPFLHIMH